MDEDSKLRALISNNFGRRKNDPSKDRKALETYVSLRGYKNGEIGNGHMSKRNLQRALRIERNLTNSMKKLLDDGVIEKSNFKVILLDASITENFYN